MGEFKLISDYRPGDDQPAAIEELVAGLRKEHRFQTLLGATGTGKTYTIANVVEQVQRPTLVIAHNKTLAAPVRAPSSVTSSRRTPSSTSSAITTTISRKPTSPRPTPTSRRTAASTTRSTGCATPPRTGLTGATSSSSPRSVAASD